MSQDNSNVIDIDKELTERGIKENAYLEIEQNFHQLLNEITNDRIREEIEKIYPFFQIAQANERIFGKLYREIKKQNTELIQKYNKITETQKEAYKEIEYLNKKIIQLQKDNQLAKEERAKEVISKFEASQMSERVRDEFSVDENEIEQLEKEKEAVKRQYELLVNNYEKLNNSYNELIVTKDTLEGQLKVIKEENVNVKEINTKYSQDKEILEKKIQEKNIEINQLKNAKDKATGENETLQTNIKVLEDKLSNTTNNLLSLKKNHDSLQLEKNNLYKQTIQHRNDVAYLHDEIEKLKSTERELIANIKRLEQEKEKVSMKINEKDIEIREKNREVDKVNKEKNTTLIELNASHNEIRLLKQEIERQKRIIDDEIRMKERVDIEKKGKEKEIKKKANEVLGLENEISEYQGELKSKEERLARLKEELSVSNKINSDLEKIRDKITEENTKLKNKIDHHLEDIRLRENRIQELLKKVNELDKKIKMQQDLYDAVRRDKNLYFKNLIETQDDLVDKQNLLNLNKHEIEQLKGEIREKEKEIGRLNLNLSDIKEQLKKKKNEADKNLKDANNLTEKTSNLEKEIEKLKTIVETTAKEYKTTVEEYKKTVIDRDNLSTQLIRRNDEVSLLHEKIKTLTTTLARAEIDYQHKINEVNLFKRQNRNLRRELEISKNFRETAHKLAREIVNLNKELLREKNLNKALTEEVESSEKSEKLFHRWRKLEGIDPDSLEMHYKISLLQKRLIAKTEECVEKEITIQDITKELAKLKELANKRPKQIIEESIKFYKEELQKNSDKMKAIIAERNLFENQSEDYKIENNRLKKEFSDFQMKYHEIKERLKRMQQKSLNNTEKVV